MATFLSPVLRPLGIDSSQPGDTAAAGAKEAQGQANSLSQLQWQRQMQGLAGATGYADQLQALYNSLYSPGGGQMAAGGSAPRAPGIADQSAMDAIAWQQAHQPATGQSDYDKYKAGYAKAGQWYHGNMAPGTTGAGLADFVPIVGAENRVVNFAQDPSLQTGAELASSVLAPGTNLVTKAGQKVWSWL